MIAATQRHISNKPTRQNKTSFGEATHYFIRIVVEEEKSYYYAKDHLGTIRTTINMMGETENTMDYFPYGQEIPDRNFFVDGAELTNEYEYDDNGNMKTDRNKGIKVMYNYLNLPSLVTWDNSKAKTWWLYTATGEKIRSAVYDEENELAKSNDYVNGFVYKRNDFELNPVFDFLQFEEGRYLAGGTGYEYHLKDHLGNVRATFDETGNVLDRNFYYPFGITIHNSLSANENRYLYNSKELETDNNLNWYHYGARFYNPQLGRWHTMDPADEFNSPYLYVGNNPIKFIDPDGRQVFVPEKINGIELDLSKDWLTYPCNTDDELRARFFVQAWQMYGDEVVKAYGPLVRNMDDFMDIRESGKYASLTFELGKKSITLWEKNGSEINGVYAESTAGMKLADLSTRIILFNKEIWVEHLGKMNAVAEEMLHAIIIRNAVRWNLPVPKAGTELRDNLLEVGTQHWLIRQFWDNLQGGELLYNINGKPYVFP